MQIVRDLAGYTMGQSDLVRRAMAKKKHDVMEKERIRLPFVSWFAYTMAIEFEAEKVKDQESFAFCAGTGTGQVRDPENPL